MNERNQFIHDVFVTACEGGINYWADIKFYRWSLGKQFQYKKDLENFRADICDMEDENKEFLINKEVIEKGFSLILAGPVEGLHECYRGPLMSCIQTNNEDGFMDAESADWIVQLGLFGEVIYG